MASGTFGLRWALVHGHPGNVVVVHLLNVPSKPKTFLCDCSMKTSHFYPWQHFIADMIVVLDL